MNMMLMVMMMVMVMMMEDDDDYGDDNDEGKECTAAMRYEGRDDPAKIGCEE